MIKKNYRQDCYMVMYLINVCYGQFDLYNIAD